MEVHPDSRHVVVIRKGQFCESHGFHNDTMASELISDWFDVLDNQDRPILNDREIFTNLKAIVKDADTTPANAVAASALGVLTTESRKIWSHLRSELQTSNKNNANSLAVVESALFVVCLDDYEPESVADICGNFLCGSYKLDGGVQVGTCTNRWYDKVCQPLSELKLMEAPNYRLLGWRSWNQFRTYGCRRSHCAPIRRRYLHRAGIALR
jgi:carnitine O-acetyltransferase